MKAKPHPNSPVGSLQRFVLVFETSDPEARKAAILALKRKIETLEPHPALIAGADVFDGYWILTLRPGQTIEIFGKALDAFICQTTAEFEAALAADSGDGSDDEEIPDDTMVR